MLCPAGRKITTQSINMEMWTVLLSLSVFGLPYISIVIDSASDSDLLES